MGVIKGLLQFVRTVYYIHKERGMRDQLEGQTVTDPVCGQLTWRTRQWEGTCALKTLGEVPLSVITWLGRPPSAAQQRAFKSFLDDEERLMKLAEQATLDYYERYVRPDYLDLPEYQDSSALRETLTKPSLLVGLEDHHCPVAVEWEHPYPGSPRKRGFRYIISFVEGEVVETNLAPESVGLWPC
jgi:hypothetical protein